MAEIKPATSASTESPTYYVRHPDDSYSVADPQPVLHRIEPWLEYDSTGHPHLIEVKIPVAVEPAPRPPVQISGERFLARLGFADSRNYSAADLGPVLEAYAAEVAEARKERG